MLDAAGAPHEPAPLVAFMGTGGGACREADIWAGTGGDAGWVNRGWYNNCQRRRLLTDVNCIPLVQYAYVTFYERTWGAAPGLRNVDAVHEWASSSPRYRKKRPQPRREGHPIGKKQTKNTQKTKQHTPSQGSQGSQELQLPAGRASLARASARAQTEATPCPPPRSEPAPSTVRGAHLPSPRRCSEQGLPKPSSSPSR